MHSSIFVLKYISSLSQLLLITPPFTQLNTPYPATAYLKGFLNTKKIDSFQMDLGIEVILALFSKRGLEQMFAEAGEKGKISSPNAQRIYALREHYEAVIDEVVDFLQGNNHTFARQICSEDFLPEGSRFEQLDDLDWAFGFMGMHDKAKHLATLMLEDLSDFIVESLDPRFGFSRYAESLGRSANSFDALYTALQGAGSFIDEITLKLLSEKLKECTPKLVCFSVPFPGNLYSAFKCAQFIKTNLSQVKIAMGGGFPNTELRSLKDPRVFEFFDFITLDDGELPIELLWAEVNGHQSKEEQKFKRTYRLNNGKVEYLNNALQSDYKQSELGTPDYSDLPLSKYISVIEIANPMHSLWSDGRWNKLTMAHGCYWGKCTFCDVSLDYIKLYEPIAAKMLVDRMEELIAQTGTNGFHFVDEAAPPALMKAVALEILKRKLTLTWWTNIRFEKSFTQDLCYLLKASGCIAVSGGLEVASNRLLALIDKGVSVEQVARVTRNFTQANIMVHAYLMYGYPTQSEQETIDSLEMVRQLFEAGVVQSGFWHQFALTAHSPIGLNPEAFGIVPKTKEITFANNDVDFTDPSGIDHSKFSFGLKKSLFNYMHGTGFDLPLKEWFDFNIPRSTVAPGYIADIIESEVLEFPKDNAKVLWLGVLPEAQKRTKRKKGKVWNTLVLTVHHKRECFDLSLELERGKWLNEQLHQLKINSSKPKTYGELKSDFETRFEDFEFFWHSKPMLTLRDYGLLVV